MQEIVGADAQIENVARLHAVGIMIVILLRSEKGHSLLAVALSASMSPPRCRRPVQSVSGLGDRGKYSVAGQANRYLLIGRKGQRGARIGHSAHHQSAVEAIGESDPLRVPGALIAQAHSGLKRLIVIDPEHACRERRSLRNQAAVLRRRSSARGCGRRSSKPGTRECWSCSTRPVTPSSFELCQAIGNVIVVFSSVLKSYAL